MAGLNAPSAPVMSAVLHCLTGKAAKEIDAQIAAESKHEISAVLVVRGTLNKGRDSSMTPTPYVSTDLLVFAAMHFADCSGPQAFTRIKGLLTAYENKTRAIQTIKDAAKAQDREPNAQEKRDMDDLYSSVFGVDKDEMNTRLRDIFGVLAVPTSGKITARVNIEEVPAEIVTRLKDTGELAF